MLVYNNIYTCPGLKQDIKHLRTEVKKERLECTLKKYFDKSFFFFDG